jgi:hypothetical protein
VEPRKEGKKEKEEEEERFIFSPKSSQHSEQTFCNTEPQYQTRLVEWAMDPCTVKRLETLVAPAKGCWQPNRLTDSFGY